MTGYAWPAAPAAVGPPPPPRGILSFRGGEKLVAACDCAFRRCALSTPGTEAGRRGAPCSRAEPAPCPSAPGAAPASSPHGPARSEARGSTRTGRRQGRRKSPPRREFAMSANKEAPRGELPPPSTKGSTQATPDAATPQRRARHRRGTEPLRYRFVPVVPPTEEDIRAGTRLLVRHLFERAMAEVLGPEPREHGCDDSPGAPDR